MTTEKIVPHNKGSKETFLANAKAAHGDRYDYTNSVYTKTSEKLEIVCKIHGVFSQKPGHHCAGIGCPACGKEATALKLSRSKDEFVARARETHGDAYTYSAVKYKNNATKVLVTCPKHGNWSVNPGSHINSQGCPSCSAPSGLNVILPASLYILKHENITKIGVTRRDVRVRVSEMQSSLGAKFAIEHVFPFSVGGDALDVETRVLRYLKTKYMQPEKKFLGSTESFLSVDEVDLLAQIGKEVMALA